MSAVSYIRNEAGEYVCPDCGVTKRRQNTMFYHMKTHIGERNHVCAVEGCSRAFLQKSGLDQHMRQMHPSSGAAPDVNCPCCPHLCRIRANMVIHVGRKHGAGWIPAYEKTGVCGGCTKSFASATAYFYHAVQCFASVAPAPVQSWLHKSSPTHKEPEHHESGGGQEEEQRPGEMKETHEKDSGCHVHHHMSDKAHVVDIQQDVENHHRSQRSTTEQEGSL